MLPAPAPALAVRTTLGLLVLVVFSTAAALLLGAGAAQASTYRFWNFWTAETGVWTYSQLGPASTFPADGSVQGWVFAATDANSESMAPAVEPAGAFESACGAIEVRADQKRVALVLDSGLPEIAPTGQTPPAVVITCAVGDTDASGYELLNSVTTLRTENGFICAINEYPAMECSASYEPAASESNAVELDASESNAVELDASEPNAVELDASEPATSEPIDPQESNALAPLTTALVIGLAAVTGFYFWRRRSS